MITSFFDGKFACLMSSSFTSAYPSNNDDEEKEINSFIKCPLQLHSYWATLTMYHHSIVSSFSNYTFSLQAYRWDQFFQLHVQVSLSRLLPKGNTKGSSAIKLLNVETRISPLSDVCS